MTHSIIVPDSLRDFANQAAVSLGIDPEGTMSTLSVPLVPSDGPDDAEPTHWGACGMMPETAREYLANHLDQFPGAMWWRWDREGNLAASYDGENLGSPWSWETSLTTAGLMVQQPLAPQP